jgi:hypothetical protein
MDAIYVVLIKSGGEIYVMLDDDAKVISFKTENEGVNYFEDIYNEYHKRGHTWSTSACIYYMTFQPSIVKVKDLEEIKSFLAEKEPNIKPVRIGNVSGAMIVILTEKEIGQKKWDEGTKLKLIS